MNIDHPVYTADEFERESRYLDKNIWESLVIEPKMRLLFCGYGSTGEHVSRAIMEGASVTVIEHRNAAINRYAHLGATVIRGSTSVIPATENAFDLAIAFHYLHEVDPLFHAQVLSELARVARRIAIVEPAPPADPLGMRIARLYSQAKRELGQFEYYQTLDYWKKLLRAVKADVSQHIFAFTKVPPKEYLADTIELLLHTIAVEEAPQSYIDELRQIARASDAQLLPPPRYVLIGAAVGEVPIPRFTIREPAPAPRTLPTPPAVQAIAAHEIVSSSPVTAETGYEFPPIDAPAAAKSQSTWSRPQAKDAHAPAKPETSDQTPAAPAPPPQRRQSEDAPFGAPFSAWQWEPPDDNEPEEPFGDPSVASSGS